MKMSILREALTALDQLRELPLQRGVGLRVVIVTPDDELEHLRAEIAPPAQSGAHTTARAPIFFLGRARVFIRGARVPITVKDMQGRAVVVEAIRAHRKFEAVDVDETNTGVLANGHAAGGKADI